MPKYISDIAAGCAVLLIAGMFQVQSGDLEGVSLLFPRMLIIFMSLGGVYLVIKGWMHRHAARSEGGEPVAVKRVGIISAGSIVYVLLIPALGFYVTTGLFLFGMAMILNDAEESMGKKTTTSICFAGILTFVVWLGFTMLLNVQTPRGVLF